MKVYEAAENYLEAILMLTHKNGSVRAVDICKFFGYSRPTVSTMLKQLRESGYVTADEKNYLTLTDEGKAIAVNIYERHCVIAKFLISIGVDDGTAFDDACKIEHDLSADTFTKLKSFVEKTVK